MCTNNDKLKKKKKHKDNNVKSTHKKLSLVKAAQWYNILEINEIKYKLDYVP